MRIPPVGGKVKAGAGGAAGAIEGAAGAAGGCPRFPVADAGAAAADVVVEEEGIPKPTLIPLVNESNSCVLGNVPVIADFVNWVSALAS